MPPAARPHAGHGGPNRILVVDDDPIVRGLEATTLEHAGFQVEMAADGEAAWRALLTHDYDLLVTDYIVPKVSGLALVRQHRVASMALPVIVISEMSDALDTAKLNRDPWSRIDAFVRKPFTTSELMAAVHRVLPATGAASEPLDFSRRSDQTVFDPIG
ncbi:MAG: response regulator [Verrucomicrobia bacterium]|nr:response regulator [Verrucomicrobiota bacterium]